jgi:hypothetical protein
MHGVGGSLNIYKICGVNGLAAMIKSTITIYRYGARPEGYPISGTPGQ